MNTMHANEHTMVIDRIRHYSATTPDTANAIAQSLVDEYMKPVRESSQDAANLINFAERRGHQASRVLNRANRRLHLIALLPGRLQRVALRKLVPGMIDRCQDLLRDIGTFTTAFSTVALHSVAYAANEASKGEQLLSQASQDYRAGREDNRCWKILSDGARQLEDLIHVLKRQEDLLTGIRDSYTNVARQLESIAKAFHAIERANGRIEDLRGEQQSIRDTGVQASLVQARLEFIRIQSAFDKEGVHKGVFIA